MHILFLTDNFPPEVNAPASRTFEHCREWVRAGCRVTVVTGAPNFPKGKVFPGYRNAWRSHETMDGIEVIRVWTYITANEGFARRIADYASFMATATLAALGVKAVDVIVATSPQLFTACAGFLAGKLKRRPYVFELRDLWPESIRTVGAMKESRALDALERLELFLYRKAARIVSVTHAFKDNLASRGIAGGKIDVVTNGADLSRFRPQPRDEDLARALALSGKTIVGYVGTHGMAHGLETVLDAAEILERQRPADDIRFLFLGDGAQKSALVAAAAARRLANVVFCDSVPKDEVVRYWSIVDFSLIHLKNSPLFRTVIPSKLFECMAMGLPVLHGVEGESAEIVRRTGCGVVFEAENPEALAQAIGALADADPADRAAMAQNGVNAAREFDRANLAAAMLGILKQVAAGEKRRRPPA